MSWFFRIVKDDSCEGVSMRCGRKVVEADSVEEADQKFASMPVIEDQHLTILTHGPYDSEQEANTARPNQ